MINGKISGAAILTAAIFFLFASGATAMSAKERIEAFKSSTKETAGVQKPKTETAQAKSEGEKAEPKKAKAPEGVSAHAAKESAESSRDAQPHFQPVTETSSAEALKKLMEGNERVVAGKPSNPNRTAQRRSETAKGQHPSAVVVTCSDSRVPPEIIFDQGYGDIFVVRTAGNVVDEVALGSIEYAVDHLGVRLIVVLGHTSCGAVTAALEEGEAPGHLPAVLNPIKPAVEKAQTMEGELLPNAIRANVKMMAQKIFQSSPGFVQMLEDCVLRVAGAVYDIDSGRVVLTYQPVL